MSVIVEFSIAGEDFQLGQVLSGPPEMQLELERVVPTGNMVMPFVWASGPDHGVFQTNVRENPLVKELLVLDTIGESGLYRIEWRDTPMDLVEGIALSNAVVLQARGNGKWVFRLRFTDHDKLSLFHNYVIEHNIPLHIDRTYTLTEEIDQGYRFDLSPEQREALVLALQRGYFETPSVVSLDELADELNITRQALSNRIRRGNEKVLRKTLLSTAANMD